MMTTGLIDRLVCGFSLKMRADIHVRTLNDNGEWFPSVTTYAHREEIFDGNGGALFIVSHIDRLHVWFILDRTC